MARDMGMKMLSSCEDRARIPEIAEYIKSKWANPASARLYDDCIAHSADAGAPLPRWYALCDNGRIVGCAGLIANDFISRQDLYPWLCALYVEPEMRGRGYGGALIEKARTDARAAGFPHLYLCTDHIGYYERYNFTYIGQGYHPWGEESRIYRG
ncbi:MAG: GNAT family N-acetyltransferase [Christensenellales bacterium]|jgi:GNAT superfamily N-acetyltransferase